ncbi:MAG TPA: hypothetical protein VJQ56_15575, partial [Blastocatellia bacterium]|nr:hypothetical protein [Blastocatellia bacterium]
MNGNYHICGGRRLPLATGVKMYALMAVLALVGWQGSTSGASNSALSNSALSNSGAAAGAQSAITGEWIIETSARADHVHLTIHRRWGNLNHMTSSFDISTDSFKGLTRAQMQSAGSPVNFQIVRDAGTLTCDGWFKGGKGSGQYSFTPNPQFISEARGLGLDDFSDDNVFAMAVHDVSLAFIRELGTHGYTQLTTDQVISMRIHGVTTEYISEFKSLGLDRLPIDQLVSMRIHGVKPAFVREL